MDRVLRLEESYAKKDGSSSGRSNSFFMLLAMVFLMAAGISWWKFDGFDDSKEDTPFAVATEAGSETSIREQVLVLLRQHNLEDDIALQDDSSPQSRAFKWLLTNDGNAQGILMNENNDNPEHAPYRVVQRYILAVFYYSTNGDNWIKKKNWMTSPDERFWEGLDGFIDRKITEIKLNTNNLYGSIPTELPGLSSLEVLRLLNNNLSGTIPTQMEALTNLRSLGLSNNKLSGSIPTELGRLTSLGSLGMYSNQLSGTIPSELGHLSSLVLLWLYRNQLSGSIPTQLAGMRNLMELKLDNNNLSGTIPTVICDNVPDLLSITHDCEKLVCCCSGDVCHSAGSCAASCHSHV